MTRVQIEQNGWERFGELAGPWRDRNRIGWDSLLPHFQDAIERTADACPQQLDERHLMAQQTSVRYTTRDAAAGEANQSLIDDVFSELAELRPDGLSYRVARSDDGLSFEHVAVVEDGPNPLLSLASFQAFSSTVAERVLEPPVVQTGEVVARYR